MKTIFLWMLLGALLGVVAASFIVPPMLSWYMTPGGVTPGGSAQIVVQVPEVIRYATSKLLLGQSVGAGIGAVLGLVFGVLLRRKRVPQPVATSAP